MENDRTLMSEKILVVDDDEKICQILSLYLRSKGYEVFTCQSGSKAITSFEEFGRISFCWMLCFPGWTVGRYSNEFERSATHR